MYFCVICSACIHRQGSLAEDDLLLAGCARQLPRQISVVIVYAWNGYYIPLSQHWIVIVTVTPINLVWICAYWKHVSSVLDTAGEKKFEHLSFVAKAALTLSHGNAALLRGDSQ